MLAWLISAIKVPTGGRGEIANLPPIAGRRRITPVVPVAVAEVVLVICDADVNVVLITKWLGGTAPHHSRRKRGRDVTIAAPAAVFDGAEVDGQRIPRRHHAGLPGEAELLVQVLHGMGVKMHGAGIIGMIVARRRETE